MEYTVDLTYTAIKENGNYYFEEDGVNEGEKVEIFLNDGTSFVTENLTTGISLTKYQYDNISSVRLVSSSESEDTGTSLIPGDDILLDGVIDTEESTLSYQENVLVQFQATNELLHSILIFQIFIFGFMIFTFVGQLIRSNITNHF